SARHVALLFARHIYKRTIRDWLSEEAIEQVSRVQRAMAQTLGIARDSLDPEIPKSALNLSGLVYTSFLSVGDPRKNPEDLLSAYLLAFRDRSDVTLVLKLATNRTRAFHETGLLRGLYESLGIRHECRVVAIADYLDVRQ